MDAITETQISEAAKLAGRLIKAATCGKPSVLVLLTVSNRRLSSLLTVDGKVVTPVSISSSCCKFLRLPKLSGSFSRLLNPLTFRSCSRRRWLNHCGKLVISPYPPMPFRCSSRRLLRLLKSSDKLVIMIMRTGTVYASWWARSQPESVLLDCFVMNLHGRIAHCSSSSSVLPRCLQFSGIACKSWRGEGTTNLAAKREATSVTEVRTVKGGHKTAIPSSGPNHWVKGKKGTTRLSNLGHFRASLRPILHDAGAFPVWARWLISSVTTKELSHYVRMT